MVPPATMGEAAAEERGLLGGTAEEQEKAPAELCGTPAQQRGFVWFAFYAIAVSCGLVLRHASRLERGLDLEKQMSPDVWAINMLNCANLRCHASVTTSVAFPKKASFVVEYWPVADPDYGVFSREHEVSSAATEVELYRLRPHTRYVAHVKLKAEGFDKIVTVAER